MRTAMIAITTSSSISVNPLRAVVRRGSIMKAMAFVWIGESIAEGSRGERDRDKSRPRRLVMSVSS